MATFNFDTEEPGQRYNWQQLRPPELDDRPDYIRKQVLQIFAETAAERGRPLPGSISSRTSELIIAQYADQAQGFGPLEPEKALQRINTTGEDYSHFCVKCAEFTIIRPKKYIQCRACLARRQDRWRKKNPEMKKFTNERRQRSS